MKSWLARNVRLGLWLHAMFLLLVDLSLWRTAVGAFATTLLETVFLPHLAFMMTFASTDYPDAQIIARSLFVLIASFALSLIYAWGLQKMARFILVVLRRATHTSRTNV